MASSPTDARRVGQLFVAVADHLRILADSGYAAVVVRAADAITDALLADRKLLVYGNGGSAADAQHIAAELVGRFSRDRAGLPAISLTCNEALLTAWANDARYDDVFARQVQALGQRGDVAWAISTSGNSPNVVNATRLAREAGLVTIGLTGAGGGALADVCDVLLPVPLTETPRIQEVHAITYHAICALVEERLTPAS